MKARTATVTAAWIWAAAHSPLQAESLEARVARLEAQNRAQEAAIQRQAATIAEQKQRLEGTPARVKSLEEDLSLEEQRAETEPATAWFQNLEIAGLIEIEASHTSPYEGGSQSDLILSTFELGIMAPVTDWVEVNASLLYEQYDTPLEVDVASITLANLEQNPLFFTAGQIYVPFGAYETNLVSDPLTLDIGEAREVAAQLGFVQGDFTGSAYLFNGDHDIDGEDQLGSWGANLGYAHEEEGRSWAFGLGYLSDLGDSDGLQDLITENRETAYQEGLDAGAADGWLSLDPTERTGGWTANAALTFGQVNFIGEYLSAIEEFEVYSLGFGHRGAKPSAWNLELGYSFTVFGRESTAAIAYQGTDEALALELPKERWLVGWSIGLFDNTALSLEWAHDRDYGTREGGTGQSSDNLAAKLAVEF